MNKKSLTIILILFSFSCLGMAGRPRPSVRIKKLKNGHYRLLVKNKPFIIKGVCYQPIPIGEDHSYDIFSSSDKPWLVDGELMKKMGVNTVRLYKSGDNPEEVKGMIRDLYKNYGIYTAMAGFLELPFSVLCRRGLPGKGKERRPGNGRSL